jgi:hypothetical protein
MDRLEIQTRLALQPQELITAFAARAALRTVPKIILGLPKNHKAIETLRNREIIPVFRAISTAWLRSEQLSDRLAPMAESAASMAFHVGGEISSKSARAVLAAASAAAECSSRATVRDAATFGATAIYASIQLSQDCESAFSNDAGNLESSASKLTRLPLWLLGEPRWANEGWAEIKKMLSDANEHWDVWTDWYEARLEGRVVDSNLEWQRVTLEEGFWGKSPYLLNAEIKRIIEGLALNRGLEPIDNVPSPITFDISKVGTIILASNQGGLPVFTRHATAEDHAKLLDVAISLARDLVKDLGARKYQARSDYQECLQKYCERLPARPSSGNILLADAEARTLRSLFGAEAQILDPAFAAKLKTFLEQHIGLRVFYSEIESFYRHVHAGRLERPLPMDAIDGVIKVVEEYSPRVFDVSVGRAIEGETVEPASTASIPENELPPENKSQPVPPADPLGTIDPKKAREFGLAGTVNNLWKAFVEGEKVYKSIDGWRKAGESLRPYVSEILAWLYKFMGDGGGIPPSPPTIGA